MIEDWLDQCPALAARIARRQMLSVMPATGVQSTDEFWEDYSFRFRPALTEKALLAGREDQANQLVNQLATTSGAHI
jgi:predicted exporter